MKRLLPLLLLIASTAYGQEIKLIGPATQVDPRQYHVVTVVGLSDDDLRKVSVTATPSAGTDILTNRPWSGHPYLQFRATAGGKYTIDVVLNGWRRAVDDAVSQAKAAGIDDESVAAIESLAKKLADAYPLRYGSCVVEVAGAPFPPPDPPGPAPPLPTPGRKRIVILLERGQMTPDQSRTVTALQSGGTAAAKYLISKAHLINVLDDDHPQAQPWLPKLGSQQLPAVIVSDAESSAVSFVGSLPNTADAVIELVKRAGG